jgi:hypothetical protein
VLNGHHDQATNTTPPWIPSLAGRSPARGSPLYLVRTYVLFRMTVSLQVPHFPSAVNRWPRTSLRQSRTPRSPPTVPNSTSTPYNAPERNESVHTLQPAHPPCVRAPRMPRWRRMTHPPCTANLPSLFLIHTHPLLRASFVRAEAPQDGEALLFTTLLVPSPPFHLPQRPLPPHLR